MVLFSIDETYSNYVCKTALDAARGEKFLYSHSKGAQMRKVIEVTAYLDSAGEHHRSAHGAAMANLVALVYKALRSTGADDTATEIAKAMCADRVAFVEALEDADEADSPLVMDIYGVPQKFAPGGVVSAHATSLVSD